MNNEPGQPPVYLQWAILVALIAAILGIGLWALD